MLQEWMQGSMAHSSIVRDLVELQLTQSLQVRLWCIVLDIVIGIDSRSEVLYKISEGFCI